MDMISLLDQRECSGCIMLLCIWKNRAILEDMKKIHKVPYFKKVIKNIARITGWKLKSHVVKIFERIILNRICETIEGKRFERLHRSDFCNSVINGKELGVQQEGDHAIYWHNKGIQLCSYRRIIARHEKEWCKERVHLYQGDVRGYRCGNNMKW